MATIGWIRVPCIRIGEKGAGVEKIAAEGGNEEQRGETGCGFAVEVVVELGEAGAEVEEGRGPGEDPTG